jgi:hypothetical protein
MARTELEVAQILRRYTAGYRLSNGPLSPEQARVVSALVACRTAALGGHVEACDACQERVIAYNSCGNRHCPKCQGARTGEWLERERSRLLPVPYAHVVFTLPHLLGPLLLQNPRVGYRLLFEATAQTLFEIAADPKHLGAQIGFLTILHTWGQTLVHHPHLHCLIPAGGLSADQTRWVACRDSFFLSVRVLGRLFRGKYLALLEESFRAGHLRFHGRLEALGEENAFRRLLREARRKNWVVYAKPPFGGPEQVLKYLARYTHRVALANSRLLQISDQEVVFTYKDYADGSRRKTLSLEPEEFIRRFLLHTLPKGFVRIRRYGLLANGQRETLLARCRAVLGTGAQAEAASHLQPEPGDPPSNESPGHDPQSRLCPACGKGRLRVIEILPRPSAQRSRAPPLPRAA